MKKQVLVGILIVSLFCIFINTSPHSSTFAEVGSHENRASNIDMTIDYGNLSQRVFSNLSGHTVFDIINETASVSFTQFAFGKFITAINGVENDANGNGYFWQYWVNDELAPVAADNYVLADEDQVLWKYCAPENTLTTPPTPGPELFLGLGIIIVVGIIIVIATSIVYLRIR